MATETTQASPMKDDVPPMLNESAVGELVEMVNLLASARVA